MVAGPLKRADEIGFQQSFDLIILLLVFRRELFICDGLGSGFLILSSSHCCSRRCCREGSHRACQNVLSVKTHRRAATGNMKSREVAGALASTASSSTARNPAHAEDSRECKACHLTYTRSGRCERACNDLPAYTN